MNNLGVDRYQGTHSVGSLRYVHAQALNIGAVVPAALCTQSQPHKYGTEISGTDGVSDLDGDNCLWKTILQFEIY